MIVVDPNMLPHKKVIIFHFCTIISPYPENCEIAFQSLLFPSGIGIIW